jgi:peptidyl-dipeptidase A
LLVEIELKTRIEYFEAKRVIDKLLAKRYRISISDLQPTNYNDELTSYLPQKFISKMDSLFIDVDPVKKTALFFKGIGLPIQDVIDNSDLKDGPGKPGLTAMINVDFKKDVRLIAGIQNTYDGMFRMMHLGGHAAHYKYISDDIPYLLKTPNVVLGEGISHYFANLASDYKWLKSELKIDESKQKEYILVCQHMQQVDRLFRCRRLLVNAEFEREIYRNPDQDLDSLWSDLNFKYLGLRFPNEKNTCFWATNKFAASLACNVHNLVLADVFAAQMQHFVEKRVLKKTNGVYSNNKAVGSYLTENLFHYGNLLPWDQLIVKATGEPLNPIYFVNQLVGNESDPNKSMKN